MTGHRLTTIASGVSTSAPAGDWMDEARCAEIGTDLFFPEPGGDKGESAKSICRRCPVRAQCLQYAMEWEDGSDRMSFGVYGGLTAKERRRLRETARREKAA